MVMETNTEKLERLEKELAEVKASLTEQDFPKITYGQYYLNTKNGCYYVVTLVFERYILVNLDYGTVWKLDPSGDMKKELKDNDFKFLSPNYKHFKENYVL